MRFARIGGTVALALAAASTLATGSASATPDVGEIYASSGKPALAANEVVRRAFDNLYGFSASLTIDTERTSDNGEKSLSRFRLLRQREPNGVQRLFTESLSPPEVAGTRVLQLDMADGSQQTYAYVRPNRDPFPTSFRVADQFLCTWFESPRRPTPLEIQLRGQHEVLARRMDQIDGEPIHRVLVRTIEPSGYDRVELAIAERDFAILEYRHYLNPGDAEPLLIARVARADMINLNGRSLPRRMTYDDRATKIQIAVTITHEELSPTLPVSLFDPRSFHRVPVDEKEVIASEKK